MNTSKIAVVCATVLVGMFLVGSMIPDPHPPATRTETAAKHYERWAVVEVTFTKGDSRLVARRHIVAPDGEWYIIPEVHKEEIGRIVQGQQVVLPSTVRLWLQPYRSLNATFSPEHGDIEHDTHLHEDGEKSHTTRAGIYFFVYR